MLELVQNLKTYIQLITSNTTWDIFLRLLLAFLLGSLIGLERESIQKPAGLRTHVLVTLGSAIFTLLSIEGFFGADPARVAAQIVSGIGFLGAGTIIKTGQYVRGLTTAATLWVSASIGMACGAGNYWTAISGTTVALLGLIFLKHVERAFASRRPPIRFILTFPSEKYSDPLISSLLQVFLDRDFKLMDLKITPRGDSVEIGLMVVPPEEVSLANLYEELIRLGARDVRKF